MALDSVLGTGSNTAGKANVDTNYNLQVNLPYGTQGGGVAATGFAALVVEEDDGSVTGTRVVKKLTACEDGALNIAQFTRVISETFPGSALNTTLYTNVLTTMTTTVAGGFVNLNAGLSTASGAVARVTSYRGFQIDPGAHTIAELIVNLTQLPVTNNVTEWGLGYASGTSAPTDGAFFRLNAAGEFRCIVNNNGTETQSGTLTFSTLVGAAITKEFYIIFNDSSVMFYIGEAFVAEIAVSAAGGLTLSSMNLPLLLRTYNSAATGAAQVLKCAGWSVRQNMSDMSKPWGDILCGGGGNASQGQTGQTLGSTANYANSANPTAAVPTNTTAALGTGLGGQFWETGTIAVNTDGIICSFQVPAGSSTAPGRGLYITMVGCDSFIQTVIAGGPLICQWSLAYGHTNVSLATTETATAKAPRRVPLHLQPITATQAVSTIVGNFHETFDPPIFVQPGEFIALVKKHIGTVLTSGTIAHVVTFNGYWE